MAIDRMKRATIVTQVASAQRLIKALHDLSIVELTDASEQLGESANGGFRRLEASTEESDRHLQKIQTVLNLLDAFVPEEQGFFQGLAPVPLLIEPEELDKALREIDLDAVHAQALELDETYRRAEREADETRNWIRDLEPYEGLSEDLKGLGSFKHTSLAFGLIPRKGLEAVEANAAVKRLMAWEVVEEGEPAKVVMAFLNEHAVAIRRVLTELGWQEQPLPSIREGIRERLAKLREDLAAIEQRQAAIRARIEDMAGLRRPLNVLKAFWESARNKSLAQTRLVAGNWVQVLTGYVRKKDVPALEDLLRREFPEASLALEDPRPGDDVPVSITLPRLIRPLQLFIDLFGRPVYYSFDPSPFLLFNFFMFFGLCFGDVGYGLMLVTLSLYLRMRTRQYEGIYNFSTLFLYSGISTIIFGALLGSWLGDLWSPKYLGEGNFLQRLQALFFSGIDPLSKPLPALGIALLIGMLNQFYGIGLLIYGAARRRDWAAAIFDGVLWLLVLPGLVLAALGSLTDLPPIVTRIGIAMTVVGAIGLVLTQGRNEEGFIAKFITGVVSLYGILGTYGITAFIGDTLSYCRLLALGVTTSIVAIAVNIMAGMLRDIPYVGWALFIAALVLGHVFNFLIGVLGAFVHSLRLIFVEFFGRFYEGGARRFQPLGFDTPEYILKKTT
jgi:V/A-type H+-transporting ATPase subunit I